MNILLISQCDKKALTRSRQILDQFAERRGDRVWQTPITQAGLDTLRRLLRQSARKNTAVACHWIRGQDHSELLWIVGDASRFNADGATPTHSTRRNVLRSADENDWHSGEDIQLLAGLAALLHDLGKASQAFQQRLRSERTERNLYRHEWVSLRLFQAFVGDDDDAGWLARLRQPTEQDHASWLERLQADGMGAACEPPFTRLPPLAAAVGWLVLTHHRLPLMPDFAEGKQCRLGGKLQGFQSRMLLNIPAHIDARWNEWRDAEAEPAQLAPYWRFPQGLPVNTPAWSCRAARLADKLAARLATRGETRWLDNLYAMHVARLSLMLADHHFSSLDYAQLRHKRGQAGYPLWANTHGGSGDFNQPLDEHLLGVAEHSALVCRALPGFERELPRLLRRKRLLQRSPDARFRWQDRAADLAAGMRARAAEQGAFIVNMASTGCGKTLGNARIMYALADPALGLRCAFALGLRALTLQTGRAFRQRLRLNDEDLAVCVGGSANTQLFEHYQQQAEASGSASRQALWDEGGEVRYEAGGEHPLLSRALRDPQTAKLLQAPLLVCTIDHLTPATESLRGGRQIAPMLRLMSGDLVLDEPDDFDLADLPALTRLAHWAGLLGSRLLLSSATLPPALIEGLFEAYLAGRRQFQANRGQPGRPLAVCCAWVDEQDQAQEDCADVDAFRRRQRQFAGRRADWLATQPARRNAELLPLSFGQGQAPALRREFAAQLQPAIERLHRLNQQRDPISGQAVSFGLVRMANIQPLFEVALALYALPWPAHWQLHLCVYHSQYPLLLRSAIERQLDQALNREQAEAVFTLPAIRRELDAEPEREHVFIVLGSPVTEVGRDHDYDWAIVEPSSMRSLIQLAGRLRRHRPDPWEAVNVLICERNLSSVEQPDQPAFRWPGFEDEAFPLDSHLLSELLEEDEYRHLDARPRIVQPEPLQPKRRLSHLEHARLAQLMSPAGQVRAASSRPGREGQAIAPLGAYSCWQQPQALLSGVLAQQQPFRAGGEPEVDLLLLPTEDGDDYALHRVESRPWPEPPHFTQVEASLNQRVPEAALTQPNIRSWGVSDYPAALAELAAELGMELQTSARRFGGLSLPQSDNGWRFHPALGFCKA